MSFPLVVFFLLYHIYTVKSIFLSISGKLINSSFLCLRQYKFLPWSKVILCFRHGDFSLEIRSENRLIKSARCATITHPRGRSWGCFLCSKWAECGYPKSQDEVKYLTQYLKISLDIVLDAKTFDASGKSDF